MSTIMAGLGLLEPSELYNILNHSPNKPYLSDPNYLLLLDARQATDYTESHVLRSKNIQPDENGQYSVPYDAELECKQYVIVYDSNTKSLKEDGPAVKCATTMWQLGSRNPVRVLKGGYEEFSALYPFLRVQKIIYMPQELDEIKTYPIEIIPGFLYLGNWRQGNAAYIQKDLKIKGHINCCTEAESFFSEEGESLMNIAVEDDKEADIQSKFQTACDFLDSHKSNENVILVFSKLGISRSITLVTAYLMHHLKIPLKEAIQQIKKCCPTAKPNVGFMKQLSRWETEKLGENSSNTK